MKKTGDFAASGLCLWRKRKSLRRKWRNAFSRRWKSIRRTRDALEWVEVREYGFENGTRILAFSNDEITDTTEICDNPYAEVEWIA